MISSGLKDTARVARPTGAFAVAFCMSQSAACSSVTGRIKVTGPTTCVPAIKQGPRPDEAGAMFKENEILVFPPTGEANSILGKLPGAILPRLYKRRVHFPYRRGQNQLFRE